MTRFREKSKCYRNRIAVSNRISSKENSNQKGSSDSRKNEEDGEQNKEKLLLVGNEDTDLREVKKDSLHFKKDLSDPQEDEEVNRKSGKLIQKVKGIFYPSENRGTKESTDYPLKEPPIPINFRDQPDSF